MVNKYRKVKESITLMLSLSQQRRSDRVAIVVTLGTALLSILAYMVVASRGATLFYTDALSHMTIARRVVDGVDSGFAQLGGVWLPLPHLLMLPFVWITPLYQSGLAGSVISMAAYVVAAAFMYKIAAGLTQSRLAGVVAAAVFGLNINVLYLQATPMTETLLFATVAAMVYGVQRWAETTHYRYLVFGGVAAVAATLTRYESWPILAVMLGVVLLIAWRQRPQGGFPGESVWHSALQWRRTRDRFILFAVLAFVGITLWVIYNEAIFGNPLYFQIGEYSKPSLWTPQSDPAVGHLGVALATYWYAMVDDISWPIMLAAVLGFVCLIVVEWRKRTLLRTLPVLSLLVMVPFYVVTLYTGQRPLHVTQISHDLYNVRFGLIMVLPMAIFVGYLVDGLPFLLRSAWRRSRLRKSSGPVRLVRMVSAGLILLGVVAFGVLLPLMNNAVATYAEPAAWQHLPNTRDQELVVQYLDSQYDGHPVLMQSFGNELVSFYTPANELVYEGTNAGDRWQSSLRHPSSHDIAWIIARRGDAVDGALIAGRAPELSGYQEVFHTPDGQYSVYRRK